MSTDPIPFAPAKVGRYLVAFAIFRKEVMYKIALQVVIRKMSNTILSKKYQLLNEVTPRL